SLRTPTPPASTLLPYTTLFRSKGGRGPGLPRSRGDDALGMIGPRRTGVGTSNLSDAPPGSATVPGHWPRARAGATIGMVGTPGRDRKSTRLNSSHVKISYAVFC